MSGKNESLFDLPPGLNRTVSQYGAGRSWWNGNLVRWVNRMLVPIGGWVKQMDLSTIPAQEPVRRTHSWRDLLKQPWAVYGAADRLWATQVNTNGTYTSFDITPSSLGYNPGGITGYGAGPYGRAAYGVSANGNINPDSTAIWSLDNFGKMLVAVSSQDGRLVVWDPVTPATIASPATGAPIDNTLVIATDEEFVMVMGGKNNPRRIKWASRRTYTDWTPTATNSAGGFDLQSNGVIIAACRVPGGILVLTDTDAHMVEYVGAPFYYGRRRVSDECDIASSGVLLPVSFGAMWLGSQSFWMYNGAVSRVPCSVEYDVFYQSSLHQPHLLHGGVNQHSQELWWFYPDQASAAPNRYVAIGYAQKETPYWTIGEMPRTAWLNPVWQSEPIGVNNLTLFLQETGNTADGQLRNVFAETGALEVSDGDTNFRIDRVYPDIVNPSNIDGNAANLSLTFKLRQAPSTPFRTYGPVLMNSPKGYNPVRMRARQIAVRVDEVTAGSWAIGKMRFRIKQAGVR